jgi:hypothetical protein
MVLMSKIQKDPSLGKGVIFFIVVGVLGFAAAPFAGFYGTIGVVSFVVAAPLALLWYINFANRKKV